VIHLENVSKTFNSGATEVHAVRDLSFEIPRGAFWSIVGPSGSGKSTVLYLIAGLTPPTSGTIRVDGVDVVSAGEEEAARLRRRKIGYVLQHFGLLPFLTAWDNVAMPLVLDGVTQADIDRRVERALTLVGMMHRKSHKPTTLSGGEQQRVAIARALVIEPTVILADEPTGNLDRTAGKAVMDLIEDVNEKTGVTILLVTHDPAFAARAERVLRLVDGAAEEVTDLAGGTHERA
jgi:putative ABC transport system ATP-binding protein